MATGCLLWKGHDSNSTVATPVNINFFLWSFNIYFFCLNLTGSKSTIYKEIQTYQ